jgi:hypothetical protein
VFIEVGLEEQSMRPETKAFIWKTYIRPVIYYGSENIYLNKSDVKKIQTMEAVMIKRMLKISPRTKNTHLLFALNIEPAAIKNEKLKLNFFHRLNDNEFTKKIVVSYQTEIECKLIRELKELIGKESTIEMTDVKKKEKELNENNTNRKEKRTM